MPNDVNGGAVAPIVATPEAAAPESTPKAPEAPKDAERWAQLGKKEKQLRQEHKRLSELRNQIDTERAAMRLPPKEASLSKEDFKKQFLQDPSALGFTAEELMNVAVNQSPQDMQLRRLQAEIEALKAGQKDVLSKNEQAQKSAYDNAVKQLSREVKMLVDSDAEYETVKATSNQEAIVKYIEDTYKDEGILLSAAEAARHVEDYLVDQALTLAKLKKVQAKLAPTGSVEAADSTADVSKGPAIDAIRQAIEQKKAQSQKQVTPTLTHTSVVRANTSAHSDADKRARAIAMIEAMKVAK